MNIKENEIIDSIKLESLDIYLLKNGIVQVNYKENKTIDVNEKKQEKEAILKITNGTKHPFLFTFGSMVMVTKEAKEYSIAIELEQPFSAVAVLVDTFAYRLMAEFYFKFYKPKVTYKVFNTMDKAVEWLLKTKK